MNKQRNLLGWMNMSRIIRYDNKTYKYEIVWPNFQLEDRVKNGDNVMLSFNNAREMMDYIYGKNKQAGSVPKKST